MSTITIGDTPVAPSTTVTISNGTDQITVYPRSIEWSIRVNAVEPRPAAVSYTTSGEPVLTARSIVTSSVLRLRISWLGIGGPGTMSRGAWISSLTITMGEEDITLGGCRVMEVSTRGRAREAVEGSIELEAYLQGDTT